MEIATGIAPIFPYFPVIGGLFDLLVRMDLARRKGHRRCSAWLRWISFQAQAEGLIEMRNAIVVGAVSMLSGLLLSGCVTPTNADKTVEMRVGETRHLTAYRSNSCGAGAPSYAEIAGRLPKSSIFRYSDGGLSSRVSRDCGKRVPTRAVNGTGIAAGTEGHRYQSGTVAIVVK